MVTNSLANLSAFDVAWVDSLSLVLECEAMHERQRSEPATSGSSQHKQQTEKPIMFIEDRGRLTSAAHRRPSSTLPNRGAIVQFELPKTEPNPARYSYMP